MHSLSTEPSAVLCVEAKKSAGLGGSLIHPCSHFANAHGSMPTSPVCVLHHPQSRNHRLLHHHQRHLLLTCWTITAQSQPSSTAAHVFRSIWVSLLRQPSPTVTNVLLGCLSRVLVSRLRSSLSCTHVQRATQSGS